MQADPAGGGGGGGGGGAPALPAEEIKQPAAKRRASEVSECSSLPGDDDDYQAAVGGGGGGAPGLPEGGDVDIAAQIGELGLAAPKSGMPVRELRAAVQVIVPRAVKAAAALSTFMPEDEAVMIPSILHGELMTLCDMVSRLH